MHTKRKIDSAHWDSRVGSVQLLQIMDNKKINPFIFSCISFSNGSFTVPYLKVACAISHEKKKNMPMTLT